MAKPEWGIRRMCRECDVSFYDMKRQPAQCPKCQTVIDPQGQEKKTVKLVEKIGKKSEEKITPIDHEDDHLTVEDDGGDDVLLSEDLDEDEDLGINTHSKEE